MDPCAWPILGLFWRCPPVAVLDPLGRLIVNTVYPFYSTGLDLTLDGRHIILGNGYLVDRESLGIVAHASTGRGGNEVRVTADGRRAYIASYNSPFATVIVATPDGSLTHAGGLDAALLKILP